jgi:hypothetical protein
MLDYVCHGSKKKDVEPEPESERCLKLDVLVTEAAFHCAVCAATLQWNQPPPLPRWRFWKGR